MKRASLRTQQLAAIHMQAKSLGMDRETYEAMLERVAGARSAKGLDARGRDAVMQELRRLRGGSLLHSRNAVPPPGDPPHVREELRSMIAKIGALLADGGKSWNYAHALARRMFHLQRVEWLTAEQMRRVIAALSYDQRRRKEKARA
jgi:phage gp16-like protein